MNNITFINNHFIAELDQGNPISMGITPIHIAQGKHFYYNNSILLNNSMN